MVESMQQSSATPPYISVFWGCGRLLHALNHTLQWLLVSTVFGTVSSLHLISFLMIFTLVEIEQCDGCRKWEVLGIVMIVVVMYTIASRMVRAMFFS